MCPTDQISTAGQIDLPKTLDHSHATALRAQLEALRGQSVTLDAQACQFIGGAGAELLLAAHAEWSDASVDFTVQNMSEKFVAGVSNLGLQQTALFQEVSQE
ncbi:anti-anti-sigma regulatory factor [Shimia isoporae]|uniref:Anti-anti-sigma regulatory factor n=1 Tax=Shimia isoporae TaxID=647720 RepID=A0A4R1NJA6_9RHOB|nr:STAS domain-containing protein [Shimia isoporae]TCL08244.1 anti-anti-sigma regulatory factor [Shimia isoporae]